MELDGNLLRRLRMDRGITPRDLCKGICSVSYLSLMENNRRPITIKVFRKLLERMDIAPGKTLNYESDELLSEALLKLVKTYIAQGKNGVALSLGENYLGQMDQRMLDFEVQAVRMRGTTMNSAIELGDFERAKRILERDVPLRSNEARMYDAWTKANFSEKTEDFATAAEFTRQAAEFAKLAGKSDLEEQLYQGKVTLLAKSGTLPSAEDLRFVVDYADKATLFEEKVFRNAWAALVLVQVGDFDQAKKYLDIYTGELQGVEIDTITTILDDVTNAFLAVGDHANARRFSLSVLDLLDETDSETPKALCWLQLSKVCRLLGDDKMADQCMKHYNAARASLEVTA